ncbi:hypothetical protein HPB49_008543 [Dermacentor silvarum]|uniref:Uncharacterized protein n=1 Tax=Dermacentor silvarum TaxID=543639 RepID=A0ACB8CE62_DERSI|nr:hypothetical protein HPB49_008543 [Dermacentor silvarum]
MATSVTKADLIQRLTKRKISVPEFIFDGDSSATSGLATNVPSAKKAARNVQAAKRRKLARLMSDDQGTSSDDGEDDVPKKLLLAEQQKNAALCRKLAALRKEKDELQARHDRLEDHLLNKLGLSMPSPNYVFLKEFLEYLTKWEEHAKTTVGGFMSATTAEGL